MTDRTTDGGTTGVDVLDVADGLYREAAVELYRAISAVRAGEFSEVRAAHLVIRELRATALQALEERSKVDKLRKQIAGLAGASLGAGSGSGAGSGGGLDFDAARAEIGRRLACLRDAGGS